MLKWYSIYIYFHIRNISSYIELFVLVYQIQEMIIRRKTWIKVGNVCIQKSLNISWNLIWTFYVSYTLQLNLKYKIKYPCFINFTCCSLFAQHLLFWHECQSVFAAFYLRGTRVRLYFSYLSSCVIIRQTKYSGFSLSLSPF